MPERVAVIPLECGEYPLGGVVSEVASEASSRVLRARGWQSTKGSAAPGLGSAGGLRLAAPGTPGVSAARARTRDATKGNGAFFFAF